MALQSKTIAGSTSSSSSWSFEVIAVENSTSTNDNTSSVTLTPYIGRIGSGSYMTGAEISCTLRISGCDPQTISGRYTTGNIPAGGWYSLGSRTFTVPHSDDGSRTVEISASFTNDVYPKSGSAVGNMTLTKINRYATITSAPNFSDEQNPTIEYSNPAGNAVTVQACICDDDGMTIYVPYRNLSATGSSYTFNLTDAERQALIDGVPDGTDQMYVRFYVKTVVDGVTTGMKYLRRRLYVVNCTPTWSVAVKDIGSYSVGTLTKDDTVMIKGFNHMYATMGVELKKSATLTSKWIKNGEQTVDTLTAEFPSSENGRFEFSATDSFGHTLSKTIYLTVIPYVTLTCNIIGNNPTADGDLAFKIAGNYFNDKFGEKGIDNVLTLKWRIKEGNNEYGEWIPITPVLTDNTYEVTINLTGLNYRSVYTVQAIATDMINTGGITSREHVVRSTPVYNWGEDNFDVNVRLQSEEIVGFNVFRGSLERGDYNKYGEKLDSAASYRNVDYVEIQPNTDYMIFLNGDQKRHVVLFYDENKTFIFEQRAVNNDGHFRTPNNACYMNFRCFNSDFDATHFFNHPEQYNVEIRKATPLYPFDKKKVLYDNSSGSNGSISLSMDYNHFRYLEIVHKISNGTLVGSIIIDTSIGEKFFLFAVEAIGNDRTDLTRTQYTMAGKVLTPMIESAGYMNVTIGASITGTFNNNYMMITKVLGYN